MASESILKIMGIHAGWIFAAVVRAVDIVSAVWNQWNIEDFMITGPVNANVMDLRIAFQIDTGRVAGCENPQITFRLLQFDTTPVNSYSFSSPSALWMSRTSRCDCEARRVDSPIMMPFG